MEDKYSEESPGKKKREESYIWIKGVTYLHEI